MTVCLMVVLIKISYKHICVIVCACVSVCVNFKRCLNKACPSVNRISLKSFCNIKSSENIKFSQLLYSLTIAPTRSQVSIHTKFSLYFHILTFLYVLFLTMSSSSLLCAYCTSRYSFLFSSIFIFFNTCQISLRLTLSRTRVVAASQKVNEINLLICLLLNDPSHSKDTLSSRKQRN